MTPEVGVTTIVARVPADLERDINTVHIWIKEEGNKVFMQSNKRIGIQSGAYLRVGSTVTE